MTRKLLYFFTIFMLLYFLTSVARDVSNTVQGKQSFTWFNTPGMTQLRIVESLIFCSGAFTTYLIFILYYASKGLLRTVGVFLAALLLLITFRYLVEEVLCPFLWGFRNYPKRVTLSYYYLDSLGVFFYYSVWGLAFFFFDFVRQKEIEKKEAQLQGRIAELSLLRAQLSPHFLFNAMNNIYSLAVTRPDAAPPVLAQLSGLMRYMLYEPAEQVPLKRELKYLLDYIELQKIRYPEPQRLQIEFGLENLELSIAPFLLLPVVENVYKHAELSNSESTVVISLVTKGTVLTLNTDNYKQAIPGEGPGIGLANVRRRLELLYADRHTFAISETAERFRVDLMIDLKDNA